MCTFTYEKPELQIAEEDIIVYKFGKIIYHKRTWLDKILKRKKIKSFKSYVYHFEYEKDKVYKTTLSEFKEHNEKLFRSGKGFYSYKDFNSNYVNAKFIIPKGSKYYLAKNVEIHRFNLNCIYHSDQIKFVDEIK